MSLLALLGSGGGAVRLSATIQLQQNCRKAKNCLTRQSASAKFTLRTEFCICVQSMARCYGATRVNSEQVLLACLAIITAVALAAAQPVTLPGQVQVFTQWHNSVNKTGPHSDYYPRCASCSSPASCTHQTDAVVKDQYSPC